eukprot:TRINITY_DN10381_c0_g1_i1.p1 TRINITY_DN10381_c0_g1~~TRINITY_DN10381_c0_g1_i1.p1  ORF type:complete len:351 (-),score=39.15 TRINITY_DN10381_c0_g1_i1:353-1405(-)
MSASIQYQKMKGAGLSCFSILCPCTIDGVKESASDLFCLGFGMIAAMAWQNAIDQGLKKAFRGDDNECPKVGPLWGFAVLEFVMAILLVIFLAWIARTFGSRHVAVKALCTLFQVVGAVVSAYAWHDAITASFEGSSILAAFLYAFIFTIVALFLIWLTRFVYERVARLHWIVGRTLFAVMILTPLTSMFICGLAWAGMVESIALKMYDSGDGSTAGFLGLLFAFAIVMTVVAVVLSVVFEKLAETGFCGRPACCGLPEYLKEPLLAMGLGTLGALAAFAWSRAFICSFFTATSDDDSTTPASSTTTTQCSSSSSIACHAPEDKWWIVLIYCLLVTAVCCWLLLLSHRLA